MTIRDVARRANVGIATVSRVLNGHPSVSQETRSRVLEAIADLEYAPNATAQKLSSGTPHAIGVFAPYFTRPVFVHRLAGIQEVLDHTEYSLVLFGTNSPSKYLTQLKQVIRQRRVDGILIISMAIPEEHRLLAERMNVPVVLVEPYSGDTSCVWIDNMLGGRLATEYLLSLGHQRIAFLGDQLEGPFGFSATNERFVGYRYALAEANIDLAESYHSFIPLQDHTVEEAIRRAYRLLDQPAPPTAIFASSDVLAAGVLEAARERGIAIPDQLSVMGFDDIDMARYLNLTTVRQPMAEGGKKAIQFLLRRLRGEIRSWQEEILDLEIIVRGTTASLT